jgi:hypothetical protein
MRVKDEPPESYGYPCHGTSVALADRLDHRDANALR